MQTAKGMLAIAVVAMVGLQACSDSEPRLMNLRATGAGPDEFAIVPNKALQMPQDLASLPEPTLGGANRADVTPLDDAVVALGGRPGASNGVPAADAGLVNYASRSGRSEGIRAELAAADLEHRRDNKGRILERMLGNTTYYNAYSKESLDQHAELERWRRAGAKNPSAPPAPN